MQQMDNRLIVPPPSYSFFWMNCLTLSLFYAKIEVELYIKWWVVFFPTICFLGYKVLRSLAYLSQYQDMAEKMKYSFTTLKINMLWKVTQLLIFSCLIIFFCFLSQFLERISKGDKRALQSFKHLAAVLAFIFLVYFGYSYAFKQLMDSEESLLISDKDSKYEKKQSTIDNLMSMIINSAFSIMGNTFTVCSGGACNNFYISTLSAFFSAFGVPIFQYIHYFNFIALIFVAVTLFSLYSVQKSIFYLPFILSFIAAIMVFTDMFVYDLDYLSYVGNGIMILGAILNMRMNKAGFF